MKLASHPCPLCWDGLLVEALAIDVARDGGMTRGQARAGLYELIEHDLFDPATMTLDVAHAGAILRQANGGAA